MQANQKGNKNFLQDKLKLELTDDKTLITHANGSAKFLGYEISVRKTSEQTQKSAKSVYLMGVLGEKIVLNLPTETMRKKLAEYEVLTEIPHDGQQKWKPLSRIKLLNNNDLEILDTYNAEIRGFCNFYSIANNSSAVNDFRYIMRYSMFKTFAKKYSISTRQAIARLRRGKNFGVAYHTMKGEQKERLLDNNGFKRKGELMESFSDEIPGAIMLTATTSLTGRLKARQCELRGSQDNLDMHPVRKR